MESELQEIIDRIIHLADSYFTHPDATSRVHSASMAVDNALIKEMIKRNNGTGWNEKYCIK